ncbi:MAG: protoporphyrinogen oxidase, partial [Chlamydiae bacterium]|nr:protoporphyrinogen oxidase [Chlamydiota bacterium]
MQKKSLIIVGAGISGLSLAWYVRKKHPEKLITVVDTQDKIGGVIGTINDDFFFETGPRTLHSKRSLAVIDLIQEVGLQQDLLYATSLDRYVYFEKQLHPLPINFWQLMRSKLTKGMWQALVKDWNAPLGSHEDESVYDFFSRHLGKKLTMQLIDPFFTGIYAGDIKELSISATMPRLKEWEKKHGSLLKAAWKEKRRQERRYVPSGLFTLKNGLEDLCHHLAKKADIRFVPK